MTRRRARRTRPSTAIERAYGSYEALLEDPDVEAIYISLPNSLHAEWSIKALEAGKHVLCEKPFSRSPAEVERAFDAAEAADRFLMEAFMYRHNPQTLQLKRLVEDGAIGELRVVRTHFSFTLTDLRNVRMLPELKGGALMDVGCYCVSGQRLLAGEPETVVAQEIPSSTGVDVRFAGSDDVRGRGARALRLRLRLQQPQRARSGRARTGRWSSATRGTATTRASSSGGTESRPR